MEVVSLEIKDVKLVKPRVFKDDRGFFQQTYHYEQYRDAGIDVRFVQDNWSRSARGVLRGLHYQLEHAQDKLVFVTRGEVFDVAMDIRKGSPTFGKWVGAILSEENHHQLFIPKGFAHGFCVLSDEVDFVYKCSDFFTPGDEYAIRWNDPDVGIDWPLQDVTLSREMSEAYFCGIVSEKDKTAPLLKDVPVEHLPV